MDIMLAANNQGIRQIIIPLDYFLQIKQEEDKTPFIESFKLLG